MNRKILFFVFFMCFSFFAVKLCNAKEKPDAINSVLGVIISISEYAQNSRSVSKLEYEERKKIKELMSDITEVDELFKLTLISFLIYHPGNAKDINYDVWFSITYEHAIKKIADIETIEALNALERLRNTWLNDSGEALILDMYIKNLKQKLNINFPIR